MHLFRLLALTGTLVSTFIRPKSQQAGHAPRPLPAVLRPTLRFLLRTWSRFPKAPGYFYQIVERWGGRLGVDPLNCRLSNGMRMKCDLTDHIQRQIYFRAAYEPIETYLFESLLRPGMVVVDAGANVGQYALIAAGAVGHDGEVHAFEPVLRNFQRLTANVLLNGLTATVRANMIALWDGAETLRLHLGSDMLGNHGAYTIGTPSERIDTVAAAGMRLDDYAVENGLTRLDFVKLDVEGAEWFALTGARLVLARWRPMMLVEINREACQRLGYQPEQIWELLRPYGYLMWAVGQSPGMCRSIDTLAGVDRANIIFHTGDLPERVIRGWSLKSVLRYHRKRAIARK